MRKCLLAGALLLIGCGGGESPAAPAPVVTVTIRNGLDVSTSITAKGTNYGTVTSSGSTTLTLPPGTTTVQWKSVKRTFSDGSAVADDLDGATLSVAQNLGVLDLTNVVDGVSYFSPRIFSNLADTISLQIVQPASSRCIGFQWGNVGLFGVAWGYYRLDPGTTMRVYRKTGCQGSWLSWTFDQLSNFQARSGTVSLRTDRLP